MIKKLSNFIRDTNIDKDPDRFINVLIDSLNIEKEYTENKISVTRMQHYIGENYIGENKIKNIDKVVGALGSINFNERIGNE